MTLLRLLAAPDRQAVTQASRDLEQELAVNAQDKGITADGDWMIKIGPLVVFFAVYPDDRCVEVLQISHV